MLFHHLVVPQVRSSNYGTHTVPRCVQWKQVTGIKRWLVFLASACTYSSMSEVSKCTFYFHSKSCKLNSKFVLSAHHYLCNSIAEPKKNSANVNFSLFTWTLKVLEGYPLRMRWCAFLFVHVASIWLDSGHLKCPSVITFNIHSHTSHKSCLRKLSKQSRTMCPNPCTLLWFCLQNISSVVSFDHSLPLIMYNSLLLGVAQAPDPHSEKVQHRFALRASTSALAARSISTMELSPLIAAATIACVEGPPQQVHKEQVTQVVCLHLIEQNWQKLMKLNKLCQEAIWPFLSGRLTSAPWIKTTPFPPDDGWSE